MGDGEKQRQLQHKLIEPLTIVIGQVSILLEGMEGQLNSSQKDRLLKVKTAAEKLNLNIREYLKGNAST